jgi:hypothetical protein
MWARHKQSVIVFFHGGSNRAGNSQRDQLGPSLSRSGQVVVSANYRYLPPNPGMPLPQTMAFSIRSRLSSGCVRTLLASAAILGAYGAWSMVRAMTRAQQPVYLYLLTWIQTGKRASLGARTTVRSFRSSTMRIRVVGV